MKSNDKLSMNQINRHFIDCLGLKNVSVEKFRNMILPNIPYEIELRGNKYMYQQQRHVKVYKVEDIYNYTKKFCYIGELK